MNDAGWSTVFEVGKIFAITELKRCFLYVSSKQMFEGKSMIDSKIKEIRSRVESGENVSGFLASLLLNENLSIDDIYANISELMLAAVDTVLL